MFGPAVAVLAECNYDVNEATSRLIDSERCCDAGFGWQDLSACMLRWAHVCLHLGMACLAMQGAKLCRA